MREDPGATSPPSGTSDLLTELERRRRRLAGSLAEIETARRHLLTLAVWGLHQRHAVSYLAEASGLDPDEIVDAHRVAVAARAPEVTRDWVLRDGVLCLPEPADDSLRWRIR